MLHLLGHAKFGSKALPLFGVLPLLIQKNHFEVYALIRSVAFIRVLLLFGGVTPLFDQFFRKTPGTQPTLSPKSKKKWATPPPPLDHPPGGDFPNFSEIRRLHGPGARDLPRIGFFRGGGAL